MLNQTSFYQCTHCGVDPDLRPVCKSCYCCENCGHDPECEDARLERQIAAADRLRDSYREGGL